MESSPFSLSAWAKFMLRIDVFDRPTSHCPPAARLQLQPTGLHGVVTVYVYSPFAGFLPAGRPGSPFYVQRRVFVVAPGPVVSPLRQPRGGFAQTSGH